jgi:hypothetical protein
LLIPLTVTVTGTLAVVDNAPMPRLQLTFLDGTVRAAVSTSSNGIYSPLLKPGNYKITPGPLPAGYFVKSITGGGRDLTSDLLSVSTGETPQFTVTVDVSSPPPWRRVSGRVQGMSQGLMPSGANVVSMTGANAGEILEASVRADGTFEFPRIIPGQYQVRTTVSRLLPPLTITVGNTDVDNVEFVVPRQIEVRGRVTLENAGVVLRLATLPITTAVGGMTSSIMTTPVRGDAFTVSLPEGEQTIALHPTAIASRGFTVKSMTYGPTNLVTNTVKIDGLDPNREILVTLVPVVIANPVKITGRVTNISPSFGPVAVRIAGGVRTSPDLITLSEKGEFEIPNLAPGSYTLNVYGPALRNEMAVPVAVGTQDITGLEISFPPHKDVVGRVAWDPLVASGVFPRWSLRLQGTSAITALITPQADGSFLAQLPVGEWRASVGGVPAAFAVKSLMYGTTNLLSTPLKVAAGDTQELRVVVGFTNAPVKVSGRLIEATREQQARVQYPPTPTTIQLSGTVPAETSLKMPEGTFEFPRVVPGSYGWIHNAGLTPITIPTRDVTDLTIRSVVGRVVLEGVTLDAGLSGTLSAYDGRTNAMARIQMDGSFLFRLPAGTYQIIWSSALAGAPYAKSVRSGSEELRNQLLTIHPDSEPAELTVTIANRP